MSPSPPITHTGKSRRARAPRLGLDGARAARNTCNARVARRVDEELGAQQVCELSHVQLRHEHRAVPSEHVAEVARERVEMAEVDVRDRLAARPDTPDRSGGRAPGATPR